MTADNLRQQRVRRLDRLFVSFPIYFITACTAKRQQLLACATVHNAFIAFAEEGTQRGAWTGRYVLMPDHLHLFVAMDDQRLNPSEWMKSLKNVISKELRVTGVPPPHWQKGFFDRVLRSSESYAEKWDYVRENPVRAGLVNHADKWPFSGEIHDLRYHDADARRS